ARLPPSQLRAAGCAVARSRRRLEGNDGHRDVPAEARHGLGSEAGVEPGRDRRLLEPRGLVQLPALPPDPRVDQPLAGHPQSAAAPASGRRPPPFLFDRDLWLARRREGVLRESCSRSKCILTVTTCPW